MNYYNSKRHKTWSKSILRRDAYLCQMCKRFGKTVEATHAHHILPVEEFPEHKSLRLNGIALCKECHNKIEPRTGEYNPPDWMSKKISQLKK